MKKFNLPMYQLNGGLPGMPGPGMRGPPGMMGMPGMRM